MKMLHQRYQKEVIIILNITFIYIYYKFYVKKSNFKLLLF